jgi:undecaprenyl-diphosphatase
LRLYNHNHKKVSANTMEILKTLILGIIQGLTEFLPVSSSGHLIIAQTLMGGVESGDGPATFLVVVLHVATGIAVLFVFRKDIIGIVRGCFSKDGPERKGSLTYSGWVILATIPAVIVAFRFKKYIDDMFIASNGAYIASFMLLVTAALLIFSSRRGASSAPTVESGGPGFNTGGLTTVRALLIGVAQAIAITPGISRSGSTIAVALILGVYREEAGRFSFMLALPAIFGAALLDFKDVLKEGSLMAVLTPSLAVGFIASFIVGIAALKLLMTFIKRGKLYYFGYYCVAAAVISITALTLRGAPPAEVAPAEVNVDAVKAVSDSTDTVLMSDTVLNDTN